MKSLKLFFHKTGILRPSKIHFLEKIALVICLILIVFLNLLSCSDEGDDVQSFLEKNDGTEWLLMNDDLIVYIRFNNNKVNLIEQWSFNTASDCYDYNPNICIPGDFEIMENSIDKLTIKGDYILSDYEFMTFSVQNNTLRVDIELCEWQEETVYFNKSIVKVNDLTKCVQIKKTNMFLKFLKTEC
jgi:hypothetical protein